jgi:aspartyl protease family protein
MLDRSMKIGLGIAVALALTLIVALVLYLEAQYPGTLGDPDNRVSLVWRLTVLAGAVASLVVTLRSERIGTVLRSLLVWIGLGIVLVVGYSYREELEPVLRRVVGNVFPSEPRTIAPGTVALRASTGRHFRAVVEINGERVQVLVDTGASDVALTKEDARRVGFDPARLTYTTPYRTANGTSFGAPVRIGSIKLGDIVVDDVPGSVAQGDLGQSLLGMSFLRRLSSFEVRGDEMILRQ